MEFLLTDLHDALRDLSLLQRRDLLEGLVILALTVIAAFLTSPIMGKCRSWVERTSDPALASKILDMLRRPVWLTVLVMGTISGGTHILKYYELSVPTIHLVGRVLESLVVFAWFVPASRIVVALCDKWSAVRPSAAEAIRLVKNLAIAAVIVQGMLMFLNVWHVDVTPLLASAGVAGLALGLALKDTLANFFGGVTLFLDRPFKTGDYVVLSTGERGEVVEIGLRSTRILTEDHIQVTVPNSVLATTKITNESAPKLQSRVRVTVGVAHGSDIELVERVLLNVASSCDLIADEPEPQVRFVTIGDASIQVELQCWIRSPEDRSPAVDFLNRLIYKALPKAGIGIPFTKKEIHGKRPEDKKSVILTTDQKN